MKCIYCNCIEAIQRHELFFGHGKRKISIDYNLIIYLCVKCHSLAHHGNKRRWQMRFCEKLGIEFFKVNFIMNKNHKQWEELEKLYMEEVADRIEEYYEVKNDKN